MPTYLCIYSKVKTKDVPERIVLQRERGYLFCTSYPALSPFFGKGPTGPKPGCLPQMAVKSRMQIIESVVKLLWTQHILWFKRPICFQCMLCEFKSALATLCPSFVQPQNYHLNGSIWTNSNLCLILFLPWVGFKFVKVGCFFTLQTLPCNEYNIFFEAHSFFW